jgi:hypothetical protein
MPRYYFHLRDGEDVLLDPEGRELSHPGAVEQMALNEARAIIADDALGGKIKLLQRIDVENEAGVLIHRLLFVDAVSIEFPPDGQAAAQQ